MRNAETPIEMLICDYHRLAVHSVCLYPDSDVNI